jgi:hypothetical protein
LRDELDGLDDADALVRDDVREHVDEQGHKLAIEDFGQILRCGKARTIGGTAVQTNHHILDHVLLPR